MPQGERRSGQDSLDHVGIDRFDRLFVDCESGPQVLGYLHHLLDIFLFPSRCGAVSFLVLPQCCDSDEPCITRLAVREDGRGLTEDPDRRLRDCLSRGLPRQSAERAAPLGHLTVI